MSYDYDSRKIGKMIKAKRCVMGMTQEQMSCSLYISVKQYARYENGDGDIPISRLCDICNILDIRVEDLLCDTQVTASFDNAIALALARIEDKLDNVLAR